MRLIELISTSFGHEAENGLISASSRTAFQWGGSIFALLLMILNRTAERSLSIQTTLLVIFLFTSLPIGLFNIARGWFGSWISFLALAANLYSPESFPVASFVLFVVIPESVTKGLRETSAGVILCLAIGVFIGLAKVRFMGESKCNLHSVFYFICLSILIYFTVIILL